MAVLRSAGVLAMLLAAGCGSAKEGTDFDHGSLQSVSNGNGTPADGAPSPAPVEARLDYPEAPYGMQVGDVIANFKFLGWSRPAEAEYDTAALVPIAFADSYDPNGDKGVQLLVVTAGAVWCTACKFEYQDLATGVVRNYEERGVNFLGTLFEDNDSGPATPKDLEEWARKYKVTFPFVLDPALKLGQYFDYQATPMSMIIDARTMRILAIETGWSSGGEGSLWAQLDALLGD